MYLYNRQLQAYQDAKVRLPETKQNELYERRTANRNRLKKNLPEQIRIGDSHFLPQGSMTIGTIIQEAGEAYDIDDGVWFYEANLAEGENGSPMSVEQTKEMVKEALARGVTFKKNPSIMDNCVRVFYDEGYHVDVPSFRAFNVDEDGEYKEIAGETGWEKSNPTEINVWFEERVELLNKTRDGLGSQMRRMVRLLKRFARSRGNAWDMPNGLKLTMLVEECLSTAFERDDECFYWTLSNLNARFSRNLEIENRAQIPPRQKLTKSLGDSNMVELRSKVEEALANLAILLDDAKCTKKAARLAWDWVFRSGDFFDEFDSKDGNEGDRGGPGIAPVIPSLPFDKKETRFG